MELTDLIAAVKAHADANYNSGGWDMIVESYEDAQIADILMDPFDFVLERKVAVPTTARQAIRLVGQVAALHADRRTDIEAEGF